MGRGPRGPAAAGPSGVGTGAVRLRAGWQGRGLTIASSRERVIFWARPESDENLNLDGPDNMT